MNVYEQHETDKKVEKEGVILDYGDYSFRIARAGGSNQKYNKTLARLTKPVTRLIQTEKIEIEVLTKILIQAHAEAVVLGWTNIKDRKGKKIPFSVKACVELFTDLPDLFEDVKTQAQNLSLFAMDIKDEQAGN